MALIEVVRTCPLGGARAENMGVERWVEHLYIFKRYEDNNWVQRGGCSGLEQGGLTSARGSQLGLGPPPPCDSSCGI